jgi:hypothetical protein
MATTMAVYNTYAEVFPAAALDLPTTAAIQTQTPMPISTPLTTKEI